MPDNNGTVLINSTTGQPEWIPASKVKEAITSGKYYSKTGKVNITSEYSGRTGSVATEDIDQAGYSPVSVGTQFRKDSERKLREKYSGLDQKLLTAAEGIASGLSLGLSDALLDDKATRFREEFNSNWKLGGEVVGIIAPTLLSGGTAGASGLLGRALAKTPTGMVGKLAAKVGEKAGSKLAAGSIRQAVAQRAVEGAVEGALWSTGQAASDLLIHDKPFSMEALMGEIGPGALFGAGIGGAIGGVGRGLKKLSSRSAKLANPMLDIDSEISKSFRNELRATVDDAATYAANIEKKMQGLEIIKQRGLRIDDAALGERRALFSEYQAKKAKLFSVLGMKEGDDLDRGIRAVFASNNPKKAIKFAQALDDFHSSVAKMDNAFRPNAMEVGYANFRNMAKPAEDLKFPGAPKAAPVGKDTRNIRKAATEGLEEVATPDDVGIKGYEDLMRYHYNEFNKALPGFAGSKKYSEKIQDLVARMDPETKRQFGAMDTLAVADALGLDMEKVPLLGPVADKVLKLWTIYRVGGLMAGGGSKKISGSLAKRAIQEGFARKGAEIGRKKGGAFGAGIAYQVASKASRGALDVVSGIGNAAGKARQRIDGAARAVFNPTVKRTIKKSVVPLAVISFGPSTEDDAKFKGKNAEFLKRQAELNRAVANPNKARAWLSGQADDLRIIDPQLADILVEKRMQQLAFLQKNLPKPNSSLPPGMDWVPPPSSVLDFTKRAQVVENPMSVFEKLEDGTISAVEIETLTNVYPELARELQTKLIDLMQDPSQLNNAQKRVIGIATGINLSPATDKDLMVFSQQKYAEKDKAKVQQQQSIAGANMIKSGVTPTPGQVYSTIRMN